MVSAGSYRIYEAPCPIQAMVHRRAHFSRRHPRPQSHQGRPQTLEHRCRNRRNVPKPRDIQATNRLRRHRCLSNRRVPNGRSKRSSSSPFTSEKVIHPPPPHPPPNFSQSPPSPLPPLFQSQTNKHLTNPFPPSPDSPSP